MSCEEFKTVETALELVQQAVYSAIPFSMTEDHCKTPPPNWLCGILPKQQQAFEKHLKWCGCEGDTECTHFTESCVPPTPLGAPSASLSSYPNWMPVYSRSLGHEVPHNEGIAERPDQFVDLSSNTLSVGVSSQIHSAQRILLPAHHRYFQDSSLHDQFHSSRSNVTNMGGRFIAQETSTVDAWRSWKLKSDIVSHPLYEQLFSAHVSCLRVATPEEHLQDFDAHLPSSHQLASRYSTPGRNVSLSGDEKEELDHFMAGYIFLLRSFKDQLYEHMRIHATEAVLACSEIEQALVRLTGVSPEEGSGATMSEDENESDDKEFYYIDAGVYEAHDSLGFGPLMPTETEKSLLQRVRQELKLELKQGYRSRITDVREEILRKRRAGKLPGETTTVLKKWWTAHSKWPYPTEDEKARLVQETGLELKQINNWFINQRKRNWHNHSASGSASKGDVVTTGQMSAVSLSLGSDALKLPDTSYL
eukprot:c23774_g2_i1 orf=501-1931(-)